MFFTRKRNGTIVVRLPDELRQLVATLVGDLRELLLSDDDQRLRRLYPTAYPDDEARDAEYQQLMHGDLIESRLAGLDVIESSLDAVELTPEELTAWMQATNSLRLVLGTQLDVSENDTPLPATHPDAAAYRLYELLGMLLSEMVEVLGSTLPPSTS
ncbi:MAG: DUF2017 domain-containing protein [Acidimicrobiia bacterium]|nr:DUF2017 domain-containing protein [Acidimicrobiia bacterium]